MQLARGHRIILLKLMEKICKGHIESVSEELATKLISLGSIELTMTTEVIPEWQGAASKLLSTLGICYAQLVMKELLIKFQPGGNPHYFVVYTLGLLATSNGKFERVHVPLSLNVLFCAVAEVVPMLGTVLSRMIPMLGASKQENMQWVFAYGD